MTGILEGVNILEMGHVVATPAASATMADWGADVIKIEPLTGELARGIAPSHLVNISDEPSDTQLNWYFQLLNRGKRGIAVNLKSDTGKEIVYKLVKTTDVFMSNYEAATLEKLGMSYETLSKINPSLVYSLLTGYGTVGPEKDERGFDFAAAWARSGLMHMMAAPEGVPPLQRGGMMDRVVGAHMVSGIMGALYHREKTGEGQKVELSLYQTGVWTVAEDIQPTLLGAEPGQHNRTQAPNPMWNQYCTKDDRWIMLAMLQPSLSWHNFLQAIERPELEHDPRFDCNENRTENAAELIKIIEERMSTKTINEWETILKKHDCIFGRVATPMEVVNNEQALVNNFFVELNHPDKSMRTVATPVKFCQNPQSVRGPAPEVGQHNEMILLDLGYGWEDIAQLKEKGVIL